MKKVYVMDRMLLITVELEEISHPSHPHIDKELCEILVFQNVTEMKFKHRKFNCFHHW